MKKLFDLKEWLTLEDAAKHLTILFGEEVKVSDVLRLALDGHLQLSVNFVNYTKARYGKIAPLAEAKWEELPPSLTGYNENIRIITSQRLNANHVINLENKISRISGVWDLAMIGGERIDIERQYQKLTGGPDIDLMCIDGTWVVDEQLETACRLAEQFEEFKYDPKMGKIVLTQLEAIHNHYPALQLPDDCVLVVRTSALRLLEDNIRDNHKKNEPSISKSAETKSRNTLLTIIAALAKQSQIDLTKPDAASRIEGCTTRYGREVKDDTIRKVIRQIDELDPAKKPN